MKNLPKIYQAEFTKKINNNKKQCYIKTEESILKEEPIKQQSPTTVTEKLDEIFSGFGYAYNKPVIITTTIKTYDTHLIARTKKNVVTLENEVIPISEILAIQNKKN